MKKALRMYVAPKVELIKMELQSVLCASVETTNFNGTGIQLRNKAGDWN